MRRDDHSAEPAPGAETPWCCADCRREKPTVREKETRVQMKKVARQDANIITVGEPNTILTSFLLSL